jgi:hypothetical protein
MSHRHVAADSGLRWIVEAFRIIASNPGPFLTMGLVVAVIALVPLLGALALGVFGPALYAGIAYAAREQSSGGRAELQHLFRGFQQPGKLPRLLMLCLPGLAAGLVVVILLVALLGSALAGVDTTALENSPELGAALGSRGLLFAVLALAIGVAAYALVFFAVPRVILTDIEPVAAMRDSFKACLTNLGAFLLFFALLLIGAVMLSLLLSWLPPVIAQLIATAVMIPVVSAALYFAWRDVFAEAGDGRDLPGPPPAIVA